MINKTKIIIKDNKEIINNNDFINKTKIIFRQEEQTIKRNEILRLNVGTQQVLLNLEEETGKLQLVNKEGNVISEVDLPTERIIKNIYYDDQTQNLVFEFDNYPSINVKLELNDFAKTSDLEDYQKKITESNKLDYGLISNPPPIPTDNNQLDNGAGYITNAALDGYAKTSDLEDYQRLIDEDNKLDYSLIENAPTIPTNNNQLTNGAGYITNAALTPYAKTDDIKRDYQPKITSSNPINYDLISNVPSFIKKDVNDLENYYTKNQTYNQEEINQLIMAIPTFAIEVVDSLPTSNISTATVYLLTIKDGETPNLYEEWIYVKGVWELLGTAKVDLKGYATENWVNTQSDLIKKADKNDVNTLSANLLNLTNRVAANENSIKTLNENLGKKIEATDLLDTNVKLSAPLVTYYNVGKITNASGTNPVTIGETGQSLRKVFDNLFNMDEIQPTIEDYPSVSCSLSYTGDERGTKISSVSYTITFNDGNYTYETTTGVKMTSYSFSNGEASSTTSTSGTLKLPSPYIVGTSSAFSTTITAKYSDGNIAKTNLGNESSNPVVQIKASSCSAYPSFSKTAVDYPYYVSSSYSTISELKDNGVDFARKSTQLTTVNGEKCKYNSDCYVWMFIRKGTTTTQPDKTIETYSTIAQDWGKLLGGTEKMGTITFNKENGVEDTFFAYRTTNTAQSGAEFKLRIYRKVN